MMEAYNGGDFGGLTCNQRQQPETAARQQPVATCPMLQGLWVAVWCKNAVFTLLVLQEALRESGIIDLELSDNGLNFRVRGF